MSDFYNSRKVKARKEHKCELCRKPINKGEVYSYNVGLWEGDFFTQKRHIKCDDKLDKYLSYIGYGEYSLDCFDDWLVDSMCNECKHYIDSDCDLEKEPIDCESFKEAESEV